MIFNQLTYNIRKTSANLSIFAGNNLFVNFKCGTASVHFGSEKTEN